MLLVGKGHVHVFGLLGVQKRAEPSRNYHQSKINVASTRRDGRRVQTHLGCVCAREPQNHFMRLQNLKYSGRSMSPFTSCGNKGGKTVNNERDRVNKNARGCGMAGGSSYLGEHDIV